MRLKSGVLTSSTVVRALGTGETALGPAERSTIRIEEGVLLLQTEPRLRVLCLVHDLLRVMAVVGLVGSAIVVVALGKNEDVVTSTERVLEDGSGAKVYIRVVARGLVSGRAVKIPDAELVDACDFLGHSLLGGPRRQLCVPSGRRAYVFRSPQAGANRTLCTTCRAGYTHRGLGTQSTLSVNPNVCAKTSAAQLG